MFRKFLINFSIFLQLAFILGVKHQNDGGCLVKVEILYPNKTIKKLKIYF
jgi:hypothetical protein